jgi:hypothetical protein
MTAEQFRKSAPQRDKAASAELCKLTVGIDTAPLSPNRMGGRHWRSNMRLKAKAKETAEWAWHKAGRPRFKELVVVTVTIRRGRVMDYDNAWASLKVVIDALFKKAITKDDSATYVRFRPLKQETGKRFKGKEEVEFKVESFEAAGPREEESLLFQDLKRRRTYG